MENSEFVRAFQLLQLIKHRLTDITDIPTYRCAHERKSHVESHGGRVRQHHKPAAAKWYSSDEFD